MHQYIFFTILLATTVQILTVSLFSDDIKNDEECLKPGLNPDPLDCHNFIICVNKYGVNKIGRIVPCPPNMGFKGETCVPMEEIEDCQEDEARGIIIEARANTAITPNYCETAVPPVSSGCNCLNSSFMVVCGVDSNLAEIVTYFASTCADIDTNTPYCAPAGHCMVPTTTTTTAAPTTTTTTVPTTTTTTGPTTSILPSTVFSCTVANYRGHNYIIPGCRSFYVCTLISNTLVPVAKYCQSDYAIDQSIICRPPANINLNNCTLKTSG